MAIQNTDPQMTSDGLICVPADSVASAPSVEERARREAREEALATEVREFKEFEAKLDSCIEDLQALEPGELEVRIIATRFVVKTKQEEAGHLLFTEQDYLGVFWTSYCGNYYVGQDGRKFLVTTPDDSCWFQPLMSALSYCELHYQAHSAEPIDIWRPKPIYKWDPDSWERFRAWRDLQQSDKPEPALMTEWLVVDNPDAPPVKPRPCELHPAVELT
jgi:hypothetical protein